MSSSEQGSSLTIECTQEHSTPVVRLVGDLDIATVSKAHEALGDVEDPAGSGVVFDLGDVTFMDSSGIGFLLTALGRFGRVRLRNPSSLIREVIQMTGLADSLPVE
ncbi:MAG: STAS domain-containing protein [Acidimicrobiales bacterium]